MFFCGKFVFEIDMNVAGCYLSLVEDMVIVGGSQYICIDEI